VTLRQRWYPWLVALVTFLVLIASAAFRSSQGVMIVPIEEDLGWSRTVTSLAISVNLVVYGITAPFAASLMERFGLRPIVVGALTLLALGTGLTAVMTASWQLVVLWGVLVGLGTGATALVFGALVANRWFTSRRGLVVGVFGAAWATGQLIFLPLLARTVEHQGWRSASLVVAVMSAALIPLVALVLRDRPSDLGLVPHGAEPVPTQVPDSNTTHSGWRAAAGALLVLRDAARTRTFWLLAATFAICGWTTNGIISSHFVPAMHDHGVGATTAAGLLVVVGVFDIVGTIGSGWLTDRVDPRLLLAVYYALRGLALLMVPVIIGPEIEPPLLLVLVLFGLDWVATVPPTVTLCREAYGVERGAVVFGWVFAAHMVGAAIAAAVSGWIRVVAGDYATAWWLAGALAVIAAVLSRMIPRHGNRAPQEQQRQPVQ
jgi:predicted MFS family arabinose efflux permease